MPGTRSRHASNQDETCENCSDRREPASVCAIKNAHTVIVCMSFNKEKFNSLLKARNHTSSAIRKQAIKELRKFRS